MNDDDLDAAIWREARATVRETRDGGADLRIDGFYQIGFRGEGIYTKPSQVLKNVLNGYDEPRPFDAPALAARVASVHAIDAAVVSATIARTVEAAVRVATDPVRPRSRPIGDLALFLVWHQSGTSATNPRTGDPIRVEAQRHPWLSLPASLRTGDDRPTLGSALVDRALAAWNDPVGIDELAPLAITPRRPAPRQPPRLFDTGDELRVLAVFDDRVELLGEGIDTRYPIALDTVCRAGAVALALSGAGRMAPADAARVIDHVVDRAEPLAWPVLSTIVLPAIAL